MLGLLLIFAVGTSEGVESEIVSVNDQTFLIRTWQVGEGLPFNQVRDVLQTRDGFIWVATLNGAARFDGIDFERINMLTAPNLSDNQIVKLYEDRADNLFMGHDTGHISVFSNFETIALECPASWQGKAVIEFFEESDGSIWAENVDGAVIRVGDGEHPLAVPRFQEETTPPISRPVHGWAVRNDRLVKFDDGAELDSMPSPWIIKEQAIQLLKRVNGDLVAGSSFGGIFIIHAGFTNVTRITVSEGLASSTVLCLAEDAEQTLWVGTTAGLQSIRVMDYTSVPESYFHDFVWRFRALRSVTPRRAGGVWLGTNKGLLYSANEKSLTRVEEIKISEECRRAILEGQEESLWINNDPEFMLRQNGPVLQSIQTNKGERDEIWAIHQAVDGQLWAGGRNGLWNNSGTAGWELVAGREKNISAVQCLASSPDSTLWLGMKSGGLAAWKNGLLTCWSIDDGLPNPHVTALCVDKEDESLWIGSCGNGLVLFRDGVFREVPFSQNIVSHIMDDGSGRLWVVGEMGLYIVEKSEVERALITGDMFHSYILYGKEEGLNPPIDISSGLSTACLTPDGRFWYASDRQLSVFQPSKVQLWTDPVPLEINHAQVNDGTVLLKGADSIQLAPGVHRLDIHFSALSFVSPSHMRFRSRLLGLGDEWTDLGTQRVASYQRLPPGTYRFELTAANRDGRWNRSPTLLNVIVKPYYWQTWWFKALMYLSIALLTTLITMAIADRINRKKLIRSEQRRAVEEERTRISMDIHDEIGSELTRLQLLCHRISMLFDKSGNEAGQTTVVEMNHVTDKLVRAFDETVWLVSPGNDNVDNLVGYLSKYVLNYLRSTNIQCDLDVPLILPNLSVLGPVRHNLYLSIKEALNNMVKHAEATQVCFSVSIDEQILKMSLHDNGKGIEAQEGERFHRGLRSMRRRMKLVGGTFDISNNKEGGATAEFKLPIKKDENR